MIPAQNVSIPVHTAPIQNFGDTVDLQSYTNATQHTVAPAAMKNPCLIRKETREQFFLKKEVNRVGRSRENVDVYITDNTSIGWVHADLISAKRTGLCGRSELQKWNFLKWASGDRTRRTCAGCESASEQ